jgi:phosphate transport system substrate-binding protein
LARGLLPGALLASVLAGPVLAGDVAVIVHPANPVNDLTTAELRRILRQERQHWRAGSRIHLVLPESGSPEKDILLRRAYRLSDLGAKQLWLGKLYRAEITAFPRVAPSNGAARRIVASASGAIAFIDAAAVDASVKMLRVDGKKPGEPGYLLSPAGS